MARKEEVGYRLGSSLGDGGLVRFACPRRPPGGLRLARRVRAWFSGKETNRNERLVYLFIAGVFTVVTAGARYSLAFVVRPFG